MTYHEDRPEVLAWCTIMVPPGGFIRPRPVAPPPPPTIVVQEEEAVCLGNQSCDCMDCQAGRDRG